MHDGHIAFALQVAKQLSLDKVFFLPERQPRTKKNFTPFEHRLKMLKLATHTHEKLEVLQLPEKKFSVKQTLPAVVAIFPDAALSLLVGSDVAKFVPSWDKVAVLLKTVDLVVGLRNSDSQKNLQKELISLSKVNNLHFVKSPKPHISSDKVRRKQQTAVPAEVIEYIKAKKLY